MKQPSLFDLTGEPAGAPAAGIPAVPDQAARDFAVDPRNDVVLEASAGTGKTRVLVDRYVRLLEAGVDPRHILAITFTRKAAAEMRERVIAEIHRRAAAGAWTAAAWRALQSHVADIQISTIDAFCFALLHEFPLEGDVEPGFEIADETEIARFANEAMDLTFRAIRGRLETDEPLRLLLARIKLPVLRGAVAALLDRRHVACPAVATFVRRQGPARTTHEIAAAFVGRIRDLMPAGANRSALLDDGPVRSPEFRWLHGDLSGLDELVDAGPARAQQLRRRLERYFLTKADEPRKKLAAAFKVDLFASADARKRHEAAVRAVSGGVKAAIDVLDAQIDVLLARGVETLLATAADRYERLLDEHGLLDFAAMLQKSVALLERQEEFARSRMKLQSRYHHVLVDEFQDTSRLQWRLVELLIDAWGEGEGATDAPTSIFVVGDRKQSIYRFRHAEVTLLDEAARKIAALRPGRGARQVITTSFRAVPELLAFVNAVSQSMAARQEDEMEATAPADRDDTRAADRFSYGDADRFPVPEIAPGALRDGEPVLGAIVAASLPGSAAAVASEVERLLSTATVRDRHGPPRAARPDDIAVLFRARQGHQAFEDALEARGIRTYVYKGLGFFDAPEVQDLQALLRYLAQPDSDLRAAELLRSRFVRLSDVALVQLAPAFAQALAAESPADRDLHEPDRGLLVRARTSLSSWLPLADRISPSELIDRIMRESAYLYELRGRRLDQARENVKKVRALIRRVESRGYATLGRLADYFETLRAGDESNAIVEASGCVNLMTVHAAKGLEFPIVFLVNLHLPGRGPGAGFTVIEHGVDGEPEVAFRSSPGLALEERREEEELRRLVYVALTRARDRLYLATELDPKGRVPRKARSLAGLLPVGLTDALAAAATATATPAVTWASPAGDFTFRVCLAAEAGPAPPAVDAPEPPRFDVTAISPPRPAPIAATAVPAGSAAPADTRPDVTAAADRLIGTLVHRLLPRALPAETDERAVADAIAALIRVGDLVDVADPAAVVAAAVTAYGRLRRHPEVLAALAAGTCHFEVPFSYAQPDGAGTVVRGVIDCLVVAPDGGVTVLEFKTGRPRPEHDAQARTYLEALQATFGTDRVEIKIIYP